ncbi:MAG: thioredoxin [Actinomycetota bacterium]
MATIELTKDNFNEVIENNATVLIDFWAEWCGPCRMFGPVFEEASTRYEDIVFAKVDTEAQPELASAFQIMSIPTLMVFRDQILLYAQPGALPAEALEQLIGKVNELDMDEVRRQVDEAEKASAQA